MHHIITEEGVIAGILATDIDVLYFQRVLKRSVLGLRAFLLADVPFLCHQIQHKIALLLALLLIRLNQRVILVRVLGDGRDRSRLHCIKVGGGHAEVPLGRGLNTIQVATKLGDVEISLQNLGLGVLLLHLHRDQHLTNLTCHSVFRGMVLGNRIVVFNGLHKQHVFDILLGQRRTALLIALQQIGVDERSHHALHVHAGVGPETAILTRHHGLLHDLGNLLQRHDDTVLAVKIRNDGGAIARIHRRLLRETSHIEVHVLDLQ